MIINYNTTRYIVIIFNLITNYIFSIQFNLLAIIYVNYKNSRYQYRNSLQFTKLFDVLEQVNAAGVDTSFSWLGLIRLAYASLNLAMTARRQITSKYGFQRLENFSFNDVHLYVHCVFRLIVPIIHFLWTLSQKGEKRK